MVIYQIIPSRDSFDHDCILASGYELFSRLNKFPLLGTDDLPRVFALYEGNVNVDFLENRTWEIVLNAFLILIWTINFVYIYLFDSHSSDGKGEITLACIVVLSKYGEIH